MARSLRIVVLRFTISALSVNASPASGSVRARPFARDLRRNAVAVSSWHADDEPIVLQFYELAMRHLGHEIVGTATDGDALIEAAMQHRPDLILTDLRMPNKDGIDASVAISALRPTPVIIVSGYYTDEAVERASEDHVMAFLVKPVKLDDLRASINLAVQNFEKMTVTLGNRTL